MVDPPDDTQYLDRDRVAWNLPVARAKTVSSDAEPDADAEGDAPSSSLVEPERWTGRQLEEPSSGSRT